MGTNSLESAIAFAGHPGLNAMFQRLFLAHPARVNESYFQHQRVALSFALPLLTAAGAALGTDVDQPRNLAKSVTVE